MGMYDNVEMVNTIKKGFNNNHNCIVFQTKDLEMTLSGFIVIDNILFKKIDCNGVYLNPLQKVSFSGEIYIYGMDANNKEISYNLLFNEGLIIECEEV